MFCNDGVALPNCLVDVCLGKVDLVFVLLLIFGKLGALEVWPGGILDGFFLLVKAYIGSFGCTFGWVWGCFQ